MFNLLNFIFSDNDDDRCSKPSRKSPWEEQIDFFYPNACQTCGKLGMLFRCTKCQMVSYCGKEHQVAHWKLHKYFCTFLAEARRKNSFLSSAKGRKQATWMHAKLACINAISSKMSRILTPYEQRVIKFARACVVCHDIDQKNLINCPKCASVSICYNHKDLLEKVHAEKCADFKLCYALDLEEFKKQVKKAELVKSKEQEDDEDSTKSGIKISKMITAPINLIPHTNKIPDSTINFIQNLKLRPHENMGLREFKIVDLLIKPLSILRALEMLDQLQKNEIVIHMIGANLDDINTYVFWETLFHLLPNLKSLKVVLTSTLFATQKLSPKLCENCQRNDKNCLFELRSLNYEKFSEDESFSLPNLAVGFSMQLKSETDSIKTVARLKIPLMLTNNLEKDVSDNQKCIEKLFGKNVKYSAFEKNPFCGVKPFLDFKTDGFFFENQFLVIYNFEEEKKDGKKRRGGSEKSK